MDRYALFDLEHDIVSEPDPAERRKLYAVAYDKMSHHEWTELGKRLKERLAGE